MIVCFQLCIGGGFVLKLCLPLTKRMIGMCVECRTYSRVRDACVCSVCSRQAERHISVGGRNSFVQSRSDRSVYQRNGDFSIARAVLKSYMNDESNSLCLRAVAWLLTLVFNCGVSRTRNNGRNSAWCSRLMV